MVHRFQRQRKCQPSVGRRRAGDISACCVGPVDFTSHLSKTCHRAYGHRGSALKFLRSLSAHLRWRIAIRRDAGTYLTSSLIPRAAQCRQSSRSRLQRCDPHGEPWTGGARSRTRCGRSSDYAERIAPKLPTRCRELKWPHPESGRARLSAAPAQSPDAGARHPRDARHALQSQYRTLPEGRQ